MQKTNQFFEFLALCSIHMGGRIARIRGKEANRIVSPVLQQRLSIDLSRVEHLIKLKDRHQLNRIDSKVLEIRDFFPETLKRSRMTYTGRMMAREATHMKLINHQIAHISGGLRHLTPVKGILYHSGPVVTFQLLSPGTFSDYRSCIRIQQNLFPVK